MYVLPAASELPSNAFLCHLQCENTVRESPECVLLVVVIESHSYEVSCLASTSANMTSGITFWAIVGFGPPTLQPFSTANHHHMLDVYVFLCFCLYK